MKYRLFTYNIDFVKSNEKEAESLASVDDLADLLFIQEAKHIDVGARLKKGFYTHQALGNDAKQGVALSWRHAKIKRQNTPPGSRPGIRHRGYVLGVSNLGLKLLPRYINYRDLVFGKTVIRVVSTHRPPQRFRRLWALFDRVLAAFVKRSPYPVIIGLDSNQSDHRGFMRQSGLVWRGVGIDGFYLSPSLVKHIVKGSLKEHPVAQSDHHPVSIELEI